MYYAQLMPLRLEHFVCHWPFLTNSTVFGSIVTIPWEWARKGTSKKLNVINFVSAPLLLGTQINRKISKYAKILIRTIK